MAAAAPGPLAGARVVELSHIMAGPVCGLMLADLGADVLKIERLPSGDDSRRMVPPTVGGESAAFMMMNRNKRGIALDLRRPEGIAAVRRLAASADVLVENFRRGAMERMGLGYETLHAENPRLVYCSISGYGRSGPLADRGGFDLVAQGMSGLMSITGEGPGRPPVKVGAPVTDIGAGILAALGVVAAYAHRLRTGEGQQVETSLFEAGLVQTYWQAAICMATGVAPGAMGSAHPLNAPYQAFETSDGWVNVGAANQRNWLALVGAIGVPALGADPRFADNAARMAHLDALAAALAPLFRCRTTAEWLAALDSAGVPAGPVLSIAEVLEHPQTMARDMVPEVEHATLGRVRTLGLPLKLSATPGGVRRGAPLLGEHTREVLREHGYSEGEIDALVAAGAALDGAGQRK